MTETTADVSTSLVDTVKSYIMSKRMIFLIVAIVLCIGIYVYINRKPKVVEETVVETNQQQQLQQQQQKPEMVFSQELVENLYRNNSNPIQYLIQLQQQGQIPIGPLPKIVIDNSVNQFIPQMQPQQPQQQQQQPQQQQPPRENLNDAKDDKEIASVINYVEEENDSKNQYQRIEEDDDGEIVNQQLTQEEIERINKKILNKSN